MSKRIGIFTLPFRFGYGGFLQAYALQNTLESLGYQVCVVQARQGYYAPPTGLKAFVVYSKRLLFKTLSLSNTPVFAEKRLNAEWPILTEKVHQFIRDYIHLKEYNSIQEITEDSFDVLVVGSDQIWRPAYSGVSLYFLNFARNWSVRRIAYAASFGSSDKEFSKDLIEKCLPLAYKFNAVSVREDSGVALFHSYFNMDAQHVLDPTMLLTRKHYESLIKTKEINSKDGAEGDLFVYVLDENTHKCEVIDSLKDEVKMHPFSIKVCGDNRNLKIEDRIQPSVEQWLSAIANSRFVVTDSFHGCVFSIIFHKPFVVLANEERGQARFESLLKIFHLEDRIVTDIDKMKSIVQRDINWGEVENDLSEWRERSIGFLKNALYEKNAL